MGISTLSGPVRSSLRGPTRPVSHPFRYFLRFSPFSCTNFVEYDVLIYRFFGQFRRFQNFSVAASLPSKSTLKIWDMETNKVRNEKLAQSNKVRNEKLAQSVRDDLANGRVPFVQKARGAFDDGSDYSRTGSHQFGIFPNGCSPSAHYAITETTEDVITEALEDVLQPNMDRREVKFGENMRSNVDFERAINGRKPLDPGSQGKVTPSRLQTDTKKEKMSEKEKLVRIYDKVLVVDNVAKAREVVAMITTKYKDLVYACDTEVNACCSYHLSFWFCNHILYLLWMPVDL